MSMIQARILSKGEVQNQVPPLESFNTHSQLEGGRLLPNPAQEVLVAWDGDEWVIHTSFVSGAKAALLITDAVTTELSLIDFPINDYLAAQGCCAIATPES